LVVEQVAEVPEQVLALKGVTVAKAAVIQPMPAEVAVLEKCPLLVPLLLFPDRP
jgi:hypothetical protein